MSRLALVLAALIILVGHRLHAATPADLAQQILGNWQYDGFFTQGHRFPNPNPNLILTFTFNADHSERLYWTRTGQSGFCERKGTYAIDGDTLTQVTTWLNPDNDPSCAQDPDMQPNKTTSNPIDITNGFLDLHLDLNGDLFLYILKQQP